MTPEQKKVIATLRSDGFGYGKIATALGLTKNQVVSYCHRNDLNGTAAAPAKSLNVNFCKNCGKPIRQKVGVRTMKFCCNECSKEWWKKHPEAINKHAIYHFTCAYCRKEFTAYGNNHRKYCSHECYVKARFGNE